MTEAMEIISCFISSAARFFSRAASSPALTAVVAQSEYANLQRVGGNFWASAETLGSICINGNPDGKDTQTLVDDAVAGITAPVTQ